MPKTKGLWVRFHFPTRTWQVANTKRRGKLIWRPYSPTPETKAPQLLHKGRKP